MIAFAARHVILICNLIVHSSFPSLLGKTTQVPQYLLSSGLLGRGQVGCTQPRRVAAISVAQRVAQEYGCALGQQVGYSIRFESVCSQETRIKYITDGMLLREIMADPLLLDYNSIVLDEAHERTVNTDILFALLKQIQHKRKRILAARKERDRATRATKSPSKSPAKSPSSIKAATSKSPSNADIFMNPSPNLAPLDLERDDKIPISKSERRALKQKRKREQKEAEAKGKTVETPSKKDAKKSPKLLPQSPSSASNTNSTSTSTPAPDSLTADSETAASNLRPVMSLDDDSIPDLDTIPNLAYLQELKLVVMSATLSASTFSHYFDSAPVLSVPGRTFPVEIFHSEEAQVDYLDAALTAVLQVHLDYKETYPGDILVFLTGSEEIELARKTLDEKMKRVRHDECPIGLQLCTLYANLPSEQQMAVFAATGESQRKVILSTNIAETSLTIPGIKFVIDTGVTKMRLYNPRTGGEVLKVVDVSQAEALQRSGRAGRDGPGSAYRLYTEQAFESMKKDLLPEILRTNLSSVVLQLKNLHVRNILHFDFMTPPSRSALTAALEELYTLRALNYNGDLSPIGRLMVFFPLPPAWARMLLKATEPDLDCAVEMAKILSIMSVEGIFWFTSCKSGSEKQAQAQRRQFVHSDGDHFTFLDAFNAYLAQCELPTMTNSQRSDWCRSHGLNQRNLDKARKVYEQLSSLVTRLGLKLGSINLRTNGTEYSACTDTDPLTKCLLQGLFHNVARRQVHDASYVTLNDSQVVYIHPSSVLIAKAASARPELIVFNNLVHTSRAYMRDCLVLKDLKWLIQLVPEAFGDGAVTEGVQAAPKIKGGKQAHSLHERLAGTNTNQSKLAQANAKEKIVLKPNKPTSSNKKPNALKTDSNARNNALASSSSKLADRPPKSEKAQRKSTGSARAVSLLDFVNGL